MALDFTEISTRVSILQEIDAEENKARKRGSVKAFEIYKKRQEDFVVEELRTEFSDKTVKNMRKITSINLAPRLVNELASIYTEEPEREFNDLSEAQQKAVSGLYDAAEVNNKLKKANRHFKLANQAFMSVWVKDGELQIKNWMPHKVDVVPDPMNPEKALAYVISVFDKFNFLNETKASDFDRNQFSALDTQPRPDGVNQKIGDGEDYKSKANKFIWWTDTHHFITNEKGQVLNEQGQALSAVDFSEPFYANPIGEIPFIDIASDKDDEFFVRDGYQITDFAVDLGKLLSDTANIAMLQGYAQAVITSEKAPVGLEVGPNKVIWLQLSDTNNEGPQPNFEFASPQPNISDNLEMIELIIRLFLNSVGLDPKLISGDLRFTSGIERLLAMIDKAQATKQDLMLFEKVEMKLLRLIIKWMNVMSDVTEDGSLDPEFRVSMPEQVKMHVKYYSPEMVQSEEEKNNSISMRLENGLISVIEAIMEDRDVDRERAEEIYKQIQKDESQFGGRGGILMNAQGGAVANQDGE